MTNTNNRSIARRTRDWLTAAALVAGLVFIAPVAAYQAGQAIVTATGIGAQTNEVQAQTLDTAFLTNGNCSFENQRVCIIPVAADQNLPLSERRFQMLRLTGEKNGEATFTTRTVSLEKALTLAAKELDRQAASK